MLYQVIEDGEITQSYSMPNHDDTHHLFTAGNRENVLTVTSNTTLGLRDYSVYVNGVGAPITITLPDVGDHKHRIYNIKKIDASANTITIDGTGAQTIDGALTQTLTTQWSCYTIQSNGFQWFII